PGVTASLREGCVEARSGPAVELNNDWDPLRCRAMCEFQEVRRNLVRLWCRPLSTGVLRNEIAADYYYQQQKETNPLYGGATVIHCHLVFSTSSEGSVQRHFVLKSCLVRFKKATHRPDFAGCREGITLRTEFEKKPAGRGAVESNRACRVGYEKNSGRVEF